MNAVGNVVKFRGNPRPVSVRPGECPATVIILPVIRIERDPDGLPLPYRRRQRKPNDQDKEIA